MTDKLSPTVTDAMIDTFSSASNIALAFDNHRAQVAAGLAAVINSLSASGDVVERVARALCELQIRKARRWDTEPAQLEATLPAAIDYAWKDFTDEARAALTGAVSDDLRASVLDLYDAFGAIHITLLADSPNGETGQTSVRIAREMASAAAKKAKALLALLNEGERS